MTINLTPYGTLYLKVSNERYLNRLQKPVDIYLSPESARKLAIELLVRAEQEDSEVSK